MGAVLVSDQLRDLLDISPESLEIAAGLVILVPALRLLIRGDQRDVLREVPDPGPVGPRGTATALGLGQAVVPVAFPIAAGPAALLVAATYGAKEGTGTALVAAVIVGVVVLAVLLAGGALSRPRWFHLVAGRVMGALMVVLAWDLVTDGVLAV
jgi:small neutral amino acid transporter SnatA (MarC family)